MKIINVNEIEKITIPEIDTKDESSAEENYKIAMEMIEFTKKKKGLGLSACQVGIFKQLFIMKFTNNFKIIINPKFKPLNSGKTRTYQEGCLSLPNKIYYVKRFINIWVDYYSIINTPDRDHIYYFHEKKSLKNLEASIYQHEFHHLQGITIRMKGITVIK